MKHIPPFDNAIAAVSGLNISMKEVLETYEVTEEQLKTDMKDLRWKQAGGVFYFDHRQIHKKYPVDTYKLKAAADLAAIKAERAASK